MIDFIVIHTYPLYWADFNDYAKGEMDFQVQFLCLHGLSSSWVWQTWADTPSLALVRLFRPACAKACQVPSL